ncbi:hypothetical protein [Tepidimonas aquatica]|uniref:Green heme protein n=1 Tax=Tepidimonas aquatica TaxID=247482 RepID=A0A554WM85_9BURK|nr:hypothetical protein [Tepidimonas aquatica]TSE24694.1 Green heme protein [Tepidimonas aquatica]
MHTTTSQPARAAAARTAVRWHQRLAAWCAGASALLAVPWASAEVPAIFRDADLALGEQLIRQHRCAQCHADKVGGDGSAIYRPQGRINTAGLLRGMVEQCNSALNLQMWPEEVTAVAAVLNRDHYRFKD